MEVIVTNNIQSLLESLKNKRVSVYCGPQARNSFENSISVNGELEQHEQHPDRWRIVVTEGIYTYFKTEIVVSVLQHPNRFEDGAKAVIRITV